MAIHRLPPLLVNQIAAGEVIERPTSVIKELMENSIDAEASRITVEIEQGGCELMRVVDDGGGITPDELPLAVAPDATSKIGSAQDLEAIATLGFRGEALASIASVSRMSIVSRPRAAHSAAKLDAEGDLIGEVEPTGGPIGTTITVRNLFYNTPARRRFMRTPQTETGRIKEIVTAIALAHPDVAVTFIKDGTTAFELPAKQSPRRRALDVLGRELESELLELSIDQGPVRLWGMIGRPGIARSTARHMMTFVNGRRISDRTINHALKEAYRGLIEPTRHPTAVLFIELDPAGVDVNVHPTKAEVRFRHQAQVHGLIRSSVRRCLQDADLAPGWQFNPRDERSPQPSAHLPPVDFGAGNVSPVDSSRAGGDPARSFVEFFHRLDAKQKGFVYTEVKQALRDDSDFEHQMQRDDAQQDEQRAGPFEDEPGDLPRIRSAMQAMQVHSSFIVTQDAQGLVIIDQHALHERVMFEKLKARVNEGALQSQQLLMPATLNVDRAQVEALESLQPMLAKLGIDAQPMGPNAIAVHAFTTLLFERKVDPVEFMSDLLDKAGDDALADDPEAALHEVLDMMACKAAIKAGDRLSDEELAELIRYRDHVERSSNCPHGRPTSLRLTIRDLEKQFGRG